MEKRKYFTKTSFTRMVNVRVPIEDYEDLYQIAQLKGCTVTSLIKRAITDFLRKEDGEY